MPDLLDILERRVAAVDRLDWRFIRDELGEWSAWFHPDWDADGQKIIVLAYDDPPSPNEMACIELLRDALPALPALLRVARASQAWRQSYSAGYEPASEDERRSRAALRLELAAAVDALEGTPDV